MFACVSIMFLFFTPCACGSGAGCEGGGKKSERGQRDGVGGGAICESSVTEGATVGWMGDGG